MSLAPTEKHRTWVEAGLSSRRSSSETPNTREAGDGGRRNALPLAGGGPDGAGSGGGSPGPSAVLGSNG